MKVKLVCQVPSCPVSGRTSVFFFYAQSPSSWPFCADIHHPERQSISRHMNIPCTRVAMPLSTEKEPPVADVFDRHVPVSRALVYALVCYGYAVKRLRDSSEAVSIAGRMHP